MWISTDRLSFSATHNASIVPKSVRIRRCLSGWDMHRSMVRINFSTHILPCLICIFLIWLPISLQLHKQVIPKYQFKADYLVFFPFFPCLSTCSHSSTSKITSHSPKFLQADIFNVYCIPHSPHVFLLHSHINNVGTLANESIPYMSKGWRYLVQHVASISSSTLPHTQNFHWFDIGK